MTTAIVEGSTVRVTERSTSGDSSLDDQAAWPSDEYDVCYFVPAGAKGNDDPGGKGYYLLDAKGSFGGSHWAYPEHLEVVMTPEQKRARKPPTIETIRNGVANSVMGMHSPVDLYEAIYTGDASFLLTGETDDGLTISFQVTVAEIEVHDEW